MKKIVNFLKGLIIGIAAIIPGLSGGTLSIIFGVYHRFVNGVNNFIKYPKMVLKDLSIYIISILIGVFLSVVLINHFYQSEKVITTMLFIGLIIGGVPLIFKEIKKEKIDFKNYFIFIFILLVVIFFTYINPKSSLDKIPNVFTKFLLGNMCAFTLVIPGISGSILLMALGYYNYLISNGSNAIISLFSFKFNDFFYYFINLLPVILGLILGIFYVSKLVVFLFKKYRNLTYTAIISLLISSLIPIIHDLDFNKTTNFDYIIGGILFLIGIYSVFYLEKYQDDEGFILSNYNKNI